MKVPAAVRKGWEHRFPGLRGRWTHWKVTGDDTLLGVVEGSRLTDALDLIEEHYGQFSSINASRATVNETSEVTDEENSFSEISNFIKDEKIISQERIRKIQETNYSVALRS
ncbi:MAG: hypothetical protein Nkreftii_003236 [Candidatus Nitrospira kreftii]|uniref:Uncharacterized protein n=1 Tax=Candidatus Nitrospira kreftii TaxID=2652173 RepID=A0A7S8IZS1_9BACT|nr:MAG: hypothetical protein Nkreftii_003236 [Candidatus Nitrospira kreftii]